MSSFFFIHCSTGCSCCSSENHIRGPYLTKEDAERRVAYYKSPDSKYWPLASQYSRRGNYYIEEQKYEVISDNRIIIQDSVYPFPEKTIVVKADGTIDDNDSEVFANEF